MGWYTEGVDAVEQILVKATRVRRKRFEAGLLFLGTLGNNAPFIGLFGTVLGILVALPAVIYYNVFQKKGADVEEGAAALGNVVIASMKATVKPNGTSGT